VNGGIINSITRLYLVGYFYLVTVVNGSSFASSKRVVKSERELRLDYGRSPHAYVNQRLQIQLELLMMSGMPLETC